MTSRLQEKYMKEVAPALMEKFGYKNVMEIPKLDKIVINTGKMLVPEYRQEKIDRYQYMEDKRRSRSAKLRVIERSAAIDESNR